MQSSAIVITANATVNEHQNKKHGKIDRENDPTSFEYLCKKIGLIHYSTKGKYNYINFIWKPIYQEIQKNRLKFDNYSQFINYLNIKHTCTKMENKFRFEYIIKELNNYDRMAEEFCRNNKQYINRLKGYAKSRKCTNMQALKTELDHYLNRYVVNENEDGNGKNTYEKQEWLILSRYICDFLENDKEYIKKIKFF
jgi:hypothetical protein